MKSLGRDRQDLIDALVAETELGGIKAGLLKKDEHLTDALRRIAKRNGPHVEPRIATVTLPAK